MDVNLPPVDGTTLEAYCKAAGVTQVEMAQAMRMPIRTFEDIIAGRAKFRPVHVKAADMALLTLARSKDDAGFLPKHLRDLVEDLAKLMHEPGPSA